MPTTRFQAASISKSVAAAAALHFAEKGKIGLDHNVNDYLQSWKVIEEEPHLGGALPEEGSEWAQCGVVGWA